MRRQNDIRPWMIWYGLVWFALTVGFIPDAGRTLSFLLLGLIVFLGIAGASER